MGGHRDNPTGIRSSIDTGISASMATADAGVATALENPELFWGIRGSGGNFGIVTEFEFRLHELGPIVLAGLALWPVDRALEMMSAWHDIVEEAPDELSTACVILTAPPEEFVPDHLKGQAATGIAVMYVGDPRGRSGCRQAAEGPGSRGRPDPADAVRGVPSGARPIAATRYA
jgi:FAD/FMN-containing dehydrogenase